MTYCKKLSNPLKRLIREKKSLEEIALSLCGDSVKDPRNKAKRMIREILGQEVLDQNAQTLGYQISKLRVSGKQKSCLRRKIPTETDNCSAGVHGQCKSWLIMHEAPARDMKFQVVDDNLIPVIKAIREVLEHFDIFMVLNALEYISLENSETLPLENTMPKLDIDITKKNNC